LSNGLYAPLGIKISPNNIPQDDVTLGKFPMVGKGTNVKSMAYVENVAAFIEYNLNNQPGEQLFNYIDKPDFDMNTLVAEVR
jgi:nucleoside-diphosphate-sugar epimerase